MDGLRARVAKVRKRDDALSREIADSAEEGGGQLGIRLGGSKVRVGPLLLAAL